MAKIGLAKLSSFTCNDFPVHRIHEVVCEGGFVAFNFHPSNSHSTHHPYSDSCCQPKDAMLLHLSRWRICCPDDLYPIKIKFAFSTPPYMTLASSSMVSFRHCFRNAMTFVLYLSSSDSLHLTIVSVHFFYTCIIYRL